MAPGNSFLDIAKTSKFLWFLILFEVRGVQKSSKMPSGRPCGANLECTMVSRRLSKALGPLGERFGRHLGQKVCSSRAYLVRPCVPAGGCRGARRRGEAYASFCGIRPGLLFECLATSGGGAADSIRFVAPSGPTVVSKRSARDL